MVDDNKPFRLGEGSPASLYGKSDPELIKAAIALAKLRNERAGLKPFDGDLIWVRPEDMDNAYCVFDAIGFNWC